MNSTNTNILQWNVQGIKHMKNELLDIIQTYKVSILALQETRLTGEYNLKIPRYNLVYKDGHFNRSPHGGVAIYIHSDVPYKEIELNTPLQAVAVEVQTNIRFSICNIYKYTLYFLTQP